MKFIPSTDEEFFTSLVNEAPLVPGWHTNTERWEDIPWLDRTLLAETAGFRQKHAKLFAASSTIVIGLGLQLKSTFQPFLQTGTLSDDSHKIVLRSVKHASHFIQWFTRGAQDEAVYQDLQKIKRTHAHLSKTIRPYTSSPDDVLSPELKEEMRIWRDAISADFEDYASDRAFAEINHYNPAVPVNQFDMVIIQLDFMVPFVLPELHGIEEGKVGTREFAGFFHHWAIMFRLLGVEDRFNLALHPSKPLVYRIMRNLFGEFLSMDLKQCQILEVYLEACTEYLKFPMSGKAFLILIASQIHSQLKDGQDFKGTEIRKLLSIKDKVTLSVVGGGLKMLKFSMWIKEAFVWIAPKLYTIVSEKYHKLGAGVYAANYNIN